MKKSVRVSTATQGAVWALAAMLAAPLCLHLSAMPAVAAEATHSSNYEAALEKLKQGEDQTAVILLKNELQANPDNVAARLLLGKAYINQGQGEPAERELRLARRRGADPDLVLLYLGEAYLAANTPQRVIDEVLPGYRSVELEAKIQVLRGRAYARLDRGLNAEDAFEKAMKLNPKAVEPYIGLAGIRVDQVRYREALEIVDQAKALDPTSVEVMAMRGDVLRLTGDLNGALASYNAVVRLKPKSFGVRLTRAAVLIDLGKYDAARQDIDAVLAVSPRNPQAKYLLSTVLAASGDKQGAEAALGDAAATLKALSPESLSTRRDIVKLAGLVAFQRGNMEEANKYLNLYVAEAPHDQAARQLLATVQVSLKNYPDAIDNLKRILTDAPDNATALVLLGQVYTGSGDITHAIDSYHQAVTLQPKNARTYLLLGMAYETQHDLASALLQYSKAAQFDPKLKAARIRVVATQIYLGQRAEAAKMVSGLLRDFPDDPESYNLAGIAYRGIGKTEQSRMYFAKAIAKSPAFLPAYLNLAAVYSQLGNADQAAKQYHAVLQRKPDNQSALLGLGHLAAARKDVKAAEDWYQRARLAGPQNPAPWSDLINLRMRAQDYSGAVAMAQEYVSKYPDNYQIKKALALALVKADRLGEAARVYQAVTKISPDRSQAFYDLAVVRQMAGNVDGARQALLSAIAWNGKFAPAYIALIQLETKAGNLSDAASLGKQLREVSPRLADGALGQGYLTTGHFGLAEKSFRNGLRRDSNDWSMTAGLYQSLLQGGKVSEAIHLMELWRQRHPGDLATEPLLAGGYLQGGQPTKAIPIYEKLVAAHPDDAKTLNDLAWAYHLVKDSRARTYAERAYKLAPQSAPIIDTLAWILVQDGQSGRALPLLRQAQARDAENPAISYHLAAALEALGRKDEARGELAKALKMSPHFEEAPQARKMMKRLSAN